MAPSPIPRPVPKKPKATVVVKPPKPPKVIVSKGGRDSGPPKSTSPAWKDYTAARWHKKHDKKPGVPGVPAGPAVVAAAPEDPIMTMFRSTLAEIRKSASPLDLAAIGRPYDESSVVAGQLGEGLRANIQKGGEAAQAQYNASRDEAQKHSAVFGISGGAGAGAMGLTDNGSALLASQSQANQAAASQAASAWQQLLLRTKSAVQGKATADRETRIGDASMSLAASLPSMYQARDTLDFQKLADQHNQDYLNATLTEKQRARKASDELQRRGQNVTIRGQDIVSADKQKSLDAAALKQAKHDKLTQAGLNKRAAKSAAKGLQGLDKVQQALKIVTPKDSQEPMGWWLMVQPKSPSGQPYGQPVKTHYADARQADANHPNGYPGGPPANVFVSGTPVAATKTVKGKSPGLTYAQWHKALGFLYLANKTPGVSTAYPNGMTMAQAIKEMKFITPEPPKPKGK